MGTDEFVNERAGLGRAGAARRPRATTVEARRRRCAPRHHVPLHRPTCDRAAAVPSATVAGRLTTREPRARPCTTRRCAERCATRRAGLLAQRARAEDWSRSRSSVSSACAPRRLLGVATPARPAAWCRPSSSTSASRTRSRTGASPSTTRLRSRARSSPTTSSSRSSRLGRDPARCRRALHADHQRPILGRRSGSRSGSATVHHSSNKCSRTVSSS